MSKVIVYGATGYSGEIIVQHLVSIGIKPIVAGRNLKKVAAIAEKYGLKEMEAFPLSDTEKLESVLKPLDVCFLAAGPYVEDVLEPVVKACIKTKTHYMDINGLYEGIEWVSTMDSQAKEAGIMLLPACGFDVVPSDCLLAHTAKRLPGTTDLKMYVDIGEKVTISRGTAKSMIQKLGSDHYLRKDGKLTRLPDIPVTSYDFGNGPVPVMGVPFGDIVTTGYSSRVPNLEVFARTNPTMAKIVGGPKFLLNILSFAVVRWLLTFLVDHFMPPGPTEDMWKTDRLELDAIATNAEGVSKKTKLTIPNTYWLTGMTASDMIKQVLADHFKPGYQTPATNFGSEYIATFQDCEYKDY